ncbi:kinase-like protein [Amanita muscaria]
MPRYRGWLSAVVKPLEDFIDDAIDPREYYIDLQEIAEGESGSVFAAQLAPNKDLAKLRLDAGLVAQDQQTLASGEPVAIAIKSVAIVPSGSPKLDELGRELKLMRGLGHENILSMDALYVDLLEDSLWIRMELMERSLADVVSLVEGGLQLHDRMIARFASDVVQAFQFLQSHQIAHRDVRSDNLLLNIQGVVKLADFSTAVQVSPASPLQDDIVGVPYWQAPEVRSPPYNALKVDVWSLGATVWELAEAEPPFSSTHQLADRFPALSDPKLFSPAFHDFLHQCSEPPDSRPDPAKLGAHQFMKNACGRNVIIQLLAQCMNIEKQQYQVEED